MLPTLLGDVTARFGPLGFPVMPVSLPTVPVTATPRHRVSGLRKGERGWMAGIIDKLPVVPGEADSAAADAYLDALAMSLSDGKIIGTEAKQLAKLAGQAGMGSDQVRSLHHRFLEGMREVALADGIITTDEAKDLRAAAKALSEPDYIDDLVVTAEERPSAAKATAPKAARPRGPLTGIRVLVVDDVPDLEATLDEAGAALATNVTATVRCVIASDPDDRRVAKAHEMGIAVVAPD